VSGDTKALYAPPREGRLGHLLWLRDRTLVAQRFDAAALKLEGDPTPLAQNIAVGGGTALNIAANRAAFWVSDTGLLVYRAGIGTGRHLVWFSRDGQRLETVLQEERDGEIAIFGYRRTEHAWLSGGPSTTTPMSGSTRSGPVAGVR
jgi:hypothetical protein